MIDSLHKSLVLLLALLQLVAPLVHAHTAGARGIAYGVHVPGLEFAAADKNLPGLHAKATRSDCCGVLIGVTSGVQQSKIFIDLPAIHALHLDFKPLHADFIVAAINFSPQPDAVISAQTALRPIAPRAPPSLPLFA